jgi:hypothetical protein
MRMGITARIVVLVAGAGALLLLAGSGQASAANCNVGVLGGGASAWDFDGGDGEFEDATLLTDLGQDPLRDDAFDDYGEVLIDGAGYENPNEAGCRYPRGGREGIFPAEEVNGVVVKPALYVHGRKTFGRQFVSLRNPGPAPVTIEFAWDGDLGSDSSTVVGTTSSGDPSMNQGDRWGTTCEDGDGDGCANVAGEAERDTELAHNWEGKGSKKHSADLVFDPELTGANVRFQFDDVTIGAGKKVTFMQIVSIAPSIKQANRAAKAIDKNPARYGAFAGLSKQERERLQNW